MYTCTRVCTQERPSCPLLLSLLATPQTRVAGASVGISACGSAQPVGSDGRAGPRVTDWPCRAPCPPLVPSAPGGVGSCPPAREMTRRSRQPPTSPAGRCRLICGAPGDRAPGERSGVRGQQLEPVLGPDTSSAGDPEDAVPSASVSPGGACGFPGEARDLLDPPGAAGETEARPRPLSRRICVGLRVPGGGSSGLTSTPAPWAGQRGEDSALLLLSRSSSLQEGPRAPQQPPHSVGRLSPAPGGWRPSG